MVSRNEYLWIANHPALDFLNTELIQNGSRTDLLRDFPHLAEWLEHAGLLGEFNAAQVIARFGTRDRTKVWEDAQQLRAAIRALVEQRAAGKRASQSALDVVNRHLQLDAGSVRLASTSAGIERRVERELRDASQLLQPLAQAAAELLCDCDPALIKPCANHACILYFYDTSKNHARRWCSMDLCGNRTKVAAHYRRNRGRV